MRSDMSFSKAWSAKAAKCRQPLVQRLDLAQQHLVIRVAVVGELDRLLGGRARERLAGHRLQAQQCGQSVEEQLVLVVRQALRQRERGGVLAGVRVVAAAGGLQPPDDLIDAEPLLTAHEGQWLREGSRRTGAAGTPDGDDGAPNSRERSHVGQ